MFLSFIFVSSFLTLTTASAHRSGSLHIPIQKRMTIIRDGVVDLDAARAHMAYSERKLLHGRAAYEHHKEARALSSSSFAQRNVVLEPLTDDRNFGWYGNISVGSPPIDFKVDFDTGIADLLLPGVNCGSTCAGHTLYDPNASSSAVELDPNITLKFHDGSKVFGEQYTDMVTVAGFTVGSILENIENTHLGLPVCFDDTQATNQSIAVASQYSAYLNSSRFAADGALGMGLPQIAMLHGTPFIQTLIAENQLPDPIFAFKLATSGSQLTIGSMNTSLYTGSITYTPVTQPGFWEIGLDSVDVNDQAATKKVSAIVDIGTSFIFSDTQTVESLYNSINASSIGNGFYTMPCNAMPNVSITIGGTSFTISPETFNMGKLNLSSDCCVGAIVGNGPFGDTWILGSSFLQNVYTIFDAGKLQVGFAKLA